eukprot:6285863-Alexandrium_andersonii.AAC.1
MSASLVGSEMCIRDRLRVVPMGSEGFRGVPMGSEGFRGVPRGLRGSEAVSYTHLTLPTICSV